MSVRNTRHFFEIFLYVTLVVPSFRTTLFFLFILLLVSTSLGCSQEPLEGMRDSTTERLSPSMKSKSSDSAIENVRPSSRLLRPAHAAGFWKKTNLIKGKWAPDVLRLFCCPSTSIPIFQYRQFSCAVGQLS